MIIKHPIHTVYLDSNNGYLVEQMLMCASVKEVPVLPQENKKTRVQL